MDDEQYFRNPTRLRPGTDERIEIYRLRHAANLPIDMDGDLKIEDILKLETLQNSKCLSRRNEEVSKLIDFSPITRKREVAGATNDNPLAPVEAMTANATKTDDPGAEVDRTDESSQEEDYQEEAIPG